MQILNWQYLYQHVAKSLCFIFNMSDTPAQPEVSQAAIVHIKPLPLCIHECAPGMAPGIILRCVGCPSVSVVPSVFSTSHHGIGSPTAQKVVPQWKRTRYTPDGAT
eukprot:gene7740-22330_t